MGGATVDELKRLRSLIDRVDGGIVRLLEERMRLCREIARVKEELGVPLEDPVREEEVLRSKGEWREVFRVIVELCKREQARVTGS